MSANPNSVTGEFMSHVAPNQQTAGSAVHNKASDDSKPEFHVEVLPAGSAPADKTHKPNPTAESVATYAPESDGRDTQEAPKAVKNALADHDHTQEEKDADADKPQTFKGAEEKVPETASGVW